MLFSKWLNDSLFMFFFLYVCIVFVVSTALMNFSNYAASSLNSNFLMLNL